MAHENEIHQLRAQIRVTDRKMAAAASTPQTRRRRRDPVEVLRDTPTAVVDVPFTPAPIPAPIAATSSTLNDEAKMAGDGAEPKKAPRKRSTRQHDRDEVAPLTKDLVNEAAVSLLLK